MHSLHSQFRNEEDEAASEDPAQAWCHLPAVAEGTSSGYLTQRQPAVLRLLSRRAGDVASELCLPSRVAPY